MKNKETLDQKLENIVSKEPSKFWKESDERVNKKETLEEAAENYSGYEEHKMDFIAGAKWQKERMYSEEEVLQILMKTDRFLKADLVIWFEQFKKK